MAKATSSVPTIEIVGLAIAPPFRARIVRQIRHALVGVQTSPVHVRVSFADVNGPKGGLDVRCAIHVKIPRTAPLHAEETATSDITAFDLSEAAISRQIARQLDGRGFVDSVRPGDWIAIHWGWACQVLSMRHVANLERWTQHHLRIVNQTL